jgi:S1/P1 Nuclease
MIIRTSHSSTHRARLVSLAAAAVVATVVTLGLGAGTASAWGCDGHHIVALIAQRHLQGSPVAAAALKLLTDHPIASSLQRFCNPKGLDAFVDAATWADDFRDVDPTTGDWHFLDIPRGETKANAGKHCPPSGCITKALEDQRDILNNLQQPGAKRADALRFVIHFAGDIHQPLHIVTNNDRGGNCVPVAFFGVKPVLTDAANGNYKPNLHGVWDTSLIARMLAANDAAASQEFAAALQSEFQAKQASWQAAGSNVDAWAWESHQLAESPGYAKLPKKIAVEKPTHVETCNDANHISKRMFDLKEKVEAPYEQVAAPVIREQLAKAGFRLAELLKTVKWQ